MNELVGGMKNALERGQDIEFVKQSFLNAGYDPAMVEEAAGIMAQLRQNSVYSLPSELSAQSSPETGLSQPSELSLQISPAPQPAKKSNWKKTMLIIVLIAAAGTALVFAAQQIVTRMIFG